MSASHQKHRHLIAIPVALLTVSAVISAQMILPTKASLIEASYSQTIETTDTSQTVTVGPMSIVLDPSSVLHVDLSGKLILEKGSMIVASKSLINAESVTGFDGALWMLKSGDSITAVALRSPFVLSAEGKSMLIPEGSQGVLVGSKIKRSTVPVSSLEEAKKRIPSFKDSSETISNPDMTLLSALRALSDPWVKQESVPSFLVTLFSSAQSLDTADMLPAHVFVSVTPLPAEAIDRWASEFLALAALNGDEAISVLDTASKLPLLFREKGFPKQEQEWAKAVDRVSRVVLTILPAEKRAALSDVLRVNRGFVSAESLQSEQPESEKKAASSLSPEELIDAGNTLIAEQDLLLSAATRVLIDSEDSSLVRIEGVFREENGDDVSYDFSYDPTSQMLSKIMRDGARLPNVVSIESFFGH